MFLFLSILGFIEGSPILFRGASYTYTSNFRDQTGTIEWNHLQMPSNDQTCSNSEDTVTSLSLTSGKSTGYLNQEWMTHII